MALAPKPDHADVPVMVGRRSTRLSVAVPITITGTDSAGNEFRENTFTLNVNKHGAEIATNRQLATNSEVTVENTTLSRKAQARVVHRREKRTPNSPYEVSLELLDPDNIWGVRFPPSDWANGSGQKGTGSAEHPETKPAPAAIKEQSQRLVPSPAEAKPNGKEPHGEAPSAPTESGQKAAAKDTSEETAIGMESPLAVAKPVAEVQGSEPPAAPVETVSNESSAAAAEPPAPSVEPEAAAPLQSVQNEQSVGTRLKDLLSRLEEASSKLESQLSQVSDARTGLQSEVERARVEIRQAGEQAAGSAIMDFRSKLSSEWEAATGPLFDDTKRRLTEDVSAAVEAFNKQAGAHLARLTQESGPELEAKQKQAVSIAKEQIAHAAESAVNEFSSKLGNAAEEFSSSLRSELKASAEKSIADESQRVGQSLREQAESLLSGEANPIPRLRQQMQTEIADAGLKFKEACDQEAEKVRSGVQEECMKSVTAVTQAAEEANAGLWESSKAIKHDLTFKGEKVRNHLSEIASASEEGFKNYTQVLVKGAQEEVREGLRVIAGRTAQEFSGELQKAIEGQLENLGPQLQKQAEDAVELCRGSLDNVSRESLAETQARVSELSRQAAEAFSSELRMLAGQFKDQLRFTVEDFRATIEQEVRNRLREVAEEEQRGAASRIKAEGKAAGENVSAEIRDRAAKATAEGERAIAETKERTEAAARSATDTVYKQIGIATVTLKDWGDQAAARLEGQFQQSMAAFERQVQDLLNRSLESSRQQAEATTEETRKRLEQATKILRGESQ